MNSREEKQAVLAIASELTSKGIMPLDEYKIIEDRVIYNKENFKKLYAQLYKRLYICADCGRDSNITWHGDNLCYRCYSKRKLELYGNVEVVNGL